MLANWLTEQEQVFALKCKPPEVQGPLIENHCFYHYIVVLKWEISYKLYFNLNRNFEKGLANFKGLLKHIEKNHLSDWALQ